MDPELDRNLHALSGGRFTIVRAQARDADTIAPLFEEYRAFYGRRNDAARAAAYLSARLSAGDAMVFYAIESSAAIGFALLYPTFSSLQLMRRLILNDLFVRETGRRRSCAMALLDHCAAFARAGDYGSISLETAVDNADAQRLYARSGYRRVTGFCGYVLDLAGDSTRIGGG